MANTFECSVVSFRIAEKERHGSFFIPQLIAYTLELSGITRWGTRTYNQKHPSARCTEEYSYRKPDLAYAVFLS
jgi:hypothetical protein